MTYEVIERISVSLNEGSKVALITLTETSGSTPRKEGTIMAVFPDGTSYGTIGGGKVEYTLINRAVEGFESLKNFFFEYELTPSGELKMMCGGKVKGYVNYFSPNRKLVIFGAGHIAQKLAPLGQQLFFDVFVTDEREGFHEYFKDVKGYYCCSPKEAVEKINIDSSTYIVITTHGHITDEKSLREVINSQAAYIGMVGSKHKTCEVRKNLLNDGFDENIVDNVYMPVGLDIARNEPVEIAVSIMAQILAVKNNRPLAKHEKEL